jgi:hypothetical protein
MGRLTPKLWMQRAVGKQINTDDLLNSTQAAIDKINESTKKTKKK